jgi:hypothetical protein
MSGVVQTTRRLSLAGRNEPVAELAQVAPQGSFWHAPAVRGHEMLQLAQTSALARCICEIESSANGRLGPFAPHLVEGRTAALSALLPTCLAKVKVRFGSCADLRCVPAERLKCAGEATFSPKGR